MEEHVKKARHLLSQIQNRELAETIVEEVEAMNYCFREAVHTLNRSNADREHMWIRKYEKLTESTVPVEALDAIINTAQTCPDRCMVDVCNDNFRAYHTNLMAKFTDDDAHTIRIVPTGKECE